MEGLIIMVGLPGSGKDTIIKKIIKDNKDKKYEVLSSDDIRDELFGGYDPKLNGEVFQEMNKRCFKMLKEGKNVIYNATNLSRKRRMALIQMCPKNIEISALLCLTSFGTLFERNLSRSERHIPEEKLLQMMRTIQVPLYYEGFDDIYAVFTDDKVDELNLWNYLNNLGKGYDQQNPHHNEDLYNHLLTTELYIKNKAPKDNILMDAACAHDWGKPYTREYNDKKGYMTYYGHQNVSAYLYLLYVENISRYRGHITHIGEYDLSVAALISHHMDKYIANLEKTKELLGDELYAKLELLMEADSYRKED